MNEFKLEECPDGRGHAGRWCGPEYKCWLDPRERSVRNADFEERKARWVAEQLLKAQNAAPQPPSAGGEVEYVIPRNLVRRAIESLERANTYLSAKVAAELTAITVQPIPTTRDQQIAKLEARVAELERLTGLAWNGQYISPEDAKTLDAIADEALARGSK